MSTAVREIEANGMRFRVRFAGDRGEPVILLHGFPETSHMWIDLMERLEGAGFRCVAPDQRGYSPGARPEGAEHYTTELLSQDVLAIAEAVGFTGRFHLVGHDWGAGVGWRLVQRHPERLASWTSLSIPHPSAYAAGYSDPDQQEKGQYIQFFLKADEPEQALSANDFARLRQVWTESSDEEVEEYVSVLSQPGALSAALNWYRANFGSGQGLGGEFTVETPTLLLWGKNDPAVGPATTREHSRYMNGPNKFVEIDAGHWLVQEKPDLVFAEVLEHMRAHPVG